MNSANCPDKELLSSFAIGTLEETTAEQLSRHVEHCPECTETLCSFDRVADTVMVQLRQPTCEPPFAEEEAFQQGLAAAEAMGNTPISISSAPGISGTDQPESLPQLRDYRLLDKLGQGGMGTVYRAVHTRLGKIVAIKLLPHNKNSDAAAIDRFSREMLAIGRLDHPHLIRAHDAGEFEKQHYLVMEYIDGLDLSVLTKSVGKLPIAEACEIIRQAALGLEYAHQSGMVHRDIKPSNLMLTTEGDIKVLDLGLALLSQGDEPSKELTCTGQIMGTIDFMAPEQGGDTHRVDIRADIYSLGATLYKLLTGEAPFADPKFTTTMQKLTLLATQEPMPIRNRRPDVSEALAAVLRRMLAKNPEQRFATPVEVAEALRPFAVGANLKALCLQARRDTQTSTLLPQTQGDSTRLSPESVDQPTNIVLTQRSGDQRPTIIRWLATAGVGAVVILAAIVFFWQTPEGTVRIEINDPEIQIAFDNAGPTITQADQKEIQLRVGTHKLFVKRGDLEFETKQFVLKNRGDEISLKIELLAGQVQVAMGDTVLGSHPIGGNAAVGHPAQPENVAVAASNADRRAAEYVLSIGGTIGVIENGKERKISDTADLPPGPVELSLLSLNWNPLVSDDGLANCKGCKNLTSLNLDGTKVTDVGLLNFKDCKHLTHLGLHDTKVSDEGLALFKGSKDLTHFDVGGTSVSDAGLAHFKACKNLTYLNPCCTQLTDAGLACFNGCKSLTVLRVGGPHVTDAGLAYFKDCQELTTLELGGPQIGDVGLAQFKDCKKIVGLYLNCGEMTEEGLLHFKDCKIGGLYLSHSQANDAWLAHFTHWKTTLGQLLLGETQVSDVGLAHLKDHDLYVLQLTTTRVTDAGLVHLKGFKHLGGLDLTGTVVSDAGLEQLASVQSLGAVELRGTKVTATGVGKLQAALPKCKIVSDFPNLAAEANNKQRPIPVGKLADLDKPFVLIRGGKPKEFKTAAGAVAELQAGDEIQVHGNGPFPLPQISLDGKGLVIRAAPGFRPRFIPSASAAEQAMSMVHGPWLSVRNGAVTLDGCDFDFVPDAGHMLIGEGGSWQISNCRLYQPDANHTQGLIYFAGPKLEISDCLIVCGFSYGSILLEENAELKLENNVFRSSAFAHILLSKGGQKLHLSRNTFAGVGSVIQLPNSDRQVTVHAESNIFSCVRGCSFIRGAIANPKAVKAQLRWNGSQNLYDLGVQFNPVARFLDHPVEQSVVTLVTGNVADWQKFLGDRERNPLSANGPTLQYQAAWIPDQSSDSLPRLRHWVNRPLSSERSVPKNEEPQPNDKPAMNNVVSTVQQPEVGPDWNMVGPGTGYLQALAAAGQVVPDKSLLPEASEEGPIMLLRNGAAIRGYANLAVALVDATNGDVVTIHSSGMIAGLNRASEIKGKRLTLRAGYGHRPSVAGLHLSPDDVWSIEGLHFTADVTVTTGKPVVGDNPKSSVPRLMNCSFEPDPDWQRCAGSRLRLHSASEDAVACEVINCVMPNYLSSAAHRIKLVNSVICGIDPENNEMIWVRQFDLERCAVFSSAKLSIASGSVAMSVTANHCWFEFGLLRHGANKASFDWRGDHNVFCHGPGKWMFDDQVQDRIWDLNAWRLRWKSDAHSRSGDAVYVDPRFYGVLPDSPAHHAAPDGANTGVDLIHFLRPDAATAEK